MEKKSFSVVEIRDVVRDGQTGNNTVILFNPKDKIWLPIIVGPSEGYNIAMWLNQLNIPRPGVYDLIKNILDMNNMRLLEGRIYLLKNNVYYANMYGIQESKNKLFHTYSEHDFVINVRPSDCMALTLQYNIPLGVHKDILDVAGITDETLKIQDAIQQAYYNQAPGMSRLGAQSRPPRKTELDILNEKLDKAVEEEKFEEAAELRDKIKSVIKKLSERDKQDGNNRRSNSSGERIE